MASYDSITTPYLLYVLLLMPALGVVSYFRLKSGKPLPPKNRRYAAMIAMQVFLVGFSLTVARQNRLDLFGRNGPAVWSWLGAALYLGFIALRLNAAWPRLSAERKQRARLLLPETPREMRYWVPISLLAGLSEECAFRGAAYIILQEVTGSAALSVSVCVLSFAVAHLLQGWRGVLGTGLIALLMHGLVYLTQGLYLAIALHVAYDLIVGATALRHFMRDRTVGVLQPESV